MGIDPVGVDENNVHSHNRYAYGNNNPYKFVDPDGRVAETVWDVANVAMDVASFGSNIAVGNYGGAAVDGIGLIIDGGATLVPFIPGGAGVAIKTARAADNIVDSAKAIRNKPDFIVSPNGTAMPTNKDFNLVDSNKNGGDWFQIHNNHSDAKAPGLSHTHYPKSHNKSTTREIKTTTGADIDKAGGLLKSGSMRERVNRNDKGGPL